MLAAQEYMAGLFERHPPPDHTSLLGEYERFVEENGDNIPLFISSAIAKVGRNKMMLSSALVNFDILHNAFSAPTKEQRRHRFEFGWSLKRDRALEDGTSPIEVSQQFLTALVNAQKDPAKQTFLWLLFLTGGRAGCVYWVPFDFWILRPDDTTTQWRFRKAQNERGDRHEATYKYSWSMPPPEAVKVFLEKYGNDSWDIIGPHKIIASIVNGWIENTWNVMEKKDRSTDCPTSSCFRDYMDKHLREVVKVDSATLKQLLDHSLKVSTSHYSTFAKNRKAAKKEIPLKARSSKRVSKN